MARLSRWTVWAVTLPFAVLWLLGAALAVRGDSLRRRRRGERPRLAYGPIPIISIKYMSGSMRRVGYDTLTLVHEVFVINAPEDFDRHLDSFATSGWRVLNRLGGGIWADYAAFAWLLSRYDVFHFFFDGGFLRRTPLRFMEIQLLHLAGKKVIVMPYGSDVALPSATQSGAWRAGLLADYPGLARGEGRRRRWIEYFSANADYVVACVVHFETLPRWDLLTIHYYPLDTDAWVPAGQPSTHDGRSGPVVVLHAPNHRALKGTDALVGACEELRQEGYEITLRLLERVANTQVREEMRRADVVAEQFILGYGLTAMEGMSLGKPVISNLTDERYYRRFREQTRLGQSPIVSCSQDELKDSLRRLIQDPALRARLGEAGRTYVLREHSYAAMAELWDAIYRRVWYGEAVEPAALLKD